MSTRNWDLGEIMGVSGQFWETCALHAGVALDLFTALGEEQLDAKEVSTRVGADPRALGMLLNALAAMELIVKADDRYTNTASAATFLSKESPRYMGYIIMHHHHLVASWSRLDEAVTTGKSVPTKVGHATEETRESFLMGMFNMAMGLAPRLVPHIDLGGRKHLLDLGGGPGTYAIFFCQQNPDLKATVFDLPTTRPFAERTIGKFGLSDRIDFQAGNYVSGDIGGRYDVAWLSHILHGEGPETCREMIRKTVSVLNPGGMIIIHEFLLDDTMDRPLFPALFSLNMLLGTPDGQAYSEKQVSGMLVDSGVKNVSRVSLSSEENSGLLTGIV